jgi:hypothetical protein
MTTELILKEGDKFVGNGLQLICTDVTNATEGGSVGEQETCYVFNNKEGRRTVFMDYELVKFISQGCTVITKGGDK